MYEYSSDHSTIYQLYQWVQNEEKCDYGFFSTQEVKAPKIVLNIEVEVLLYLLRHPLYVLVCYRAVYAFKRSSKITKVHNSYRPRESITVLVILYSHSTLYTYTLCMWSVISDQWSVISKSITRSTMYTNTMVDQYNLNQRVSQKAQR